MARCFIGVLLTEEVKKSIESVKNELKKLPIKCKFIERENLHICLSFLGEVSEVKEISEQLEVICSNYNKFDVLVDGIKLIPSESYIRVLALDVIDKSGSLKQIIEGIQKRIGGKFHPPHVTLCRVKNIEDKTATVQKIKSVKTEDLTFNVSSIHIIKSELRKTGPVYTSIYDVRLK